MHTHNPGAADWVDNTFWQWRLASKEGNSWKFSPKYFLALQHLWPEKSMTETKGKSDRRKIIRSGHNEEERKICRIAFHLKPFLYETLTLITLAVINLHSIPGRSTLPLKHCFRCFFGSQSLTGGLLFRWRPTAPSLTNERTVHGATAER